MAKRRRTTATTPPQTDDDTGMSPEVHRRLAAMGKDGTIAELWQQSRAYLPEASYRTASSGRPDTEAPEALVASRHTPVNYVRPVLLVAVIVNALVALALGANGIPMPGWFAAILVTASLALVCSRLVPRQVPVTSRASNA